MFGRDEEFRRRTWEKIGGSGWRPNYRILRKIVEVKVELPEGQYTCPECGGTGEVLVGYCDPGPNEYHDCMKCFGRGAVTYCDRCGGATAVWPEERKICIRCSRYLLVVNVARSKGLGEFLAGVGAALSAVIAEEIDAAMVADAGRFFR